MSHNDSLQLVKDQHIEHVIVHRDRSQITSSKKGGCIPGNACVWLWGRGRGRGGGGGSGR